MSAIYLMYNTQEPHLLLGTSQRTQWIFPSQSCLLIGFSLPACLSGAAPLNLADLSSCSPKKTILPEAVFCLSVSLFQLRNTCYVLPFLLPRRWHTITADDLACVFHEFTCHFLSSSRKINISLEDKEQPCLYEKLNIICSQQDWMIAEQSELEWSSRNRARQTLIMKGTFLPGLFAKCKHSLFGTSLEFQSFLLDNRVLFF